MGKKSYICHENECFHSAAKIVSEVRKLYLYKNINSTTFALTLKMPPSGIIKKCEQEKACLKWFDFTHRFR